MAIEQSFGSKVKITFKSDIGHPQNVSIKPPLQVISCFPIKQQTTTSHWASDKIIYMIFKGPQCVSFILRSRLISDFLSVSESVILSHGCILSAHKSLNMCNCKCVCVCV